MTKGQRIRFIIATVINITIFALAIYCLVLFIKYILNGSEDNRFRYFTNVSNLTVGTLSLVNAVFLIISLIKGEVFYPKAMSIIKYMGLSMTTLTFFTVLFVIAPIAGFPYMYGEVRFITHLVIPLAGMLSYLFLEETTLFEWKYSLLGFVPFFIYSLVYVPNVIFLHTWPDLYHINTYGLWYLLLIAFYAGNFGITQGLYFLKKLINKKVFKQEN